jgi:hypothetical protein
MALTSSNGWQRLSTEAQNEIMAGALAIRRIRQHEDYTHWVQVGRALLRLQEEAMHLSGANSPQGRGYTAMRADLGSRVPDLDSINKTTRAHSVWLAQNFGAVEKWRATLATNVREMLNHPTALRRRYDAAHAMPHGGKPTPPLTPSQRTQSEIVRLQDELDTAKAELRKAHRGQDNLTEGRDWTWQDSAEDIATAWFRLYPSKSLQIASKVVELGKVRTKKARSAKTARASEENEARPRMSEEEYDRERQQIRDRFRR